MTTPFSRHDTAQAGNVMVRSLGERPSECLRLVFAGDFCLSPDAPVMRLDVLRDVGERLRDAHIGVVNLEGPIVDNSIERRKGVTVHLRNADISLKVLSQCGFDVLNLANNHIMDFGPTALMATLARIDGAGMKALGAGSNMHAARMPLCLQAHGKKVGVLALTTDAPSVRSVLATGDTAGCAPMPDIEDVADTVRALRQEVDLVCVLLHWGHEYHRYPAWEQRVLARRMVESGARLVIGHHPHVAQGLEFHEGGVIAYSLGNFFFPQVRGSDGRIRWEKPLCREFLTLVVDMDERLDLQVSLLAGERSPDGVLAPYTGGAEDDFLRQFEALCASLHHPDYEAWYARYAARRRHALEREAVKEAILKAANMPLGKLLREVRPDDIKRNFRRLAAFVKRSPGGAF